MNESGLELVGAELPFPAAGVFTTRADGDSPDPWAGVNLALHTGDHHDRVAGARARLAAELGLTALAFGQQVHGARVHVVEGPPGTAPDGWPDTDALVTTTPCIGLVMMGADCLPVLLADPFAPVVAAAHVGRQGLAGGVLTQVLKVMAEHGGRAERTTVSIGPGICGRCYEVPETLAAQVEAAAPGSRARTRQGTASVDLVAGVRRQLECAGVLQVQEMGGCTAEQPDRFFSYRRDGVTGRHAGVGWLR